MTGYTREQVIFELTKWIKEKPRVLNIVTGDIGWEKTEEDLGWDWPGGYTLIVGNDALQYRLRPYLNFSQNHVEDIFFIVPFSAIYGMQGFMVPFSSDRYVRSIAIYSGKNTTLCQFIYEVKDDTESSRRSSVGDRSELQSNISNEEIE